MKYLINFEEVGEVEFESRLYEHCEEIANENYDEWLDEIYGDVEIAGFTYCTSEALREVDPIAYKVGISDYVSSMYDDYMYELKTGNIVEINGIIYEISEDDEELFEGLGD